jgi:riboflavin kinase / FMN adenylyltransferase
MRPLVVALGNFDGVHLGHQEVLKRAVEEGRRRGMRVIAATFHPHPRAVLGAGDPPKLITPVELRCEMLLSYGADAVWVIPFDVAMSRKTPEQFVKDVLIGEGGAGVVVVGENFRFGHKAVGHFSDLHRLMREEGGTAVGVQVRGGGMGGGISSTRIRALISGGEVTEAAGLLGRPYVLRGEVVDRLPDSQRAARYRRRDTGQRGLRRIRPLWRKGICRLYERRGSSYLRAHREPRRGLPPRFRG